jgi:hypothetical protein
MTKVAPYTMADDDDVSETNTPSTARSTNPLQATSTTTPFPAATYFDGSNHRPESPATGTRRKLSNASIHAEELCLANGLLKVQHGTLDKRQKELDAQRTAAKNHVHELSTQLHTIEQPGSIHQLPNKDQNPTDDVLINFFILAEPDRARTSRDRVPTIKTQTRIAEWLSNLSHDASNRAELAALFNTPQDYSEEELDALNNGRTLAAIFNFSGLVSSSITDSTLSSVDLCESFFNGGRGDCYGRVNSLVPAPPSEVCAFYFDLNSRFKSQDVERASLRKILGKPNGHSNLLRRVKYTNIKGISGREFVTIEFW